MNYINKLYNEEVTILYNDRLHRYLWEEEDKIITSVTTAQNIIDKPALKQWAVNMGVEVLAEMLTPGVSYDELEIANMLETVKYAHKSSLKKAADLGTILHEWIESYIKWQLGANEEPGMPVNKILQQSVRMFLKWIKQHHVEFHLSEQICFSRKYEYAGTIDFIATIDGELFIGDLKTSVGIYDTMMTQVAAYRYARTEEFPEEDYAGMLILRIGKDGSFGVGVMRGNKIYKMLFQAFLTSLVAKKAWEKVSSYEPDRRL